MVAYDERLRKQPLQFAQQCHEACLLFQRACVLRLSPAVQSAFVADAHAVAVVVPAVRPHLFQRPSAADFAVAGDVEVIADVAEAAVADVVRPALFEAKALPLAGGRAMDNNQRYGSHPLMHDEIPNAPARAVATVTITLSTRLHTDFFLLVVSLILIIGNFVYLKIEN